MRNLFRSTILLLPIAVGACSTGERGLVSPHQPVVTANAAFVPHCPDWSDNNLPAQTDGQASNYGCATAVNLAAMIADPMDLLHGKSVTGSNVEVSTRAIRAWREMQPTSKMFTVTTNVSSKGN